MLASAGGKEWVQRRPLLFTPLKLAILKISIAWKSRGDVNLFLVFPYSVIAFPLPGPLSPGEGRGEGEAR